MRIVALLSVAVLLLFGPSIAQAKTCQASGHPACSITCPDDQGCAAGYREPNGPCKTACYPPKSNAGRSLVNPNVSNQTGGATGHGGQTGGLVSSRGEGGAMRGTPCRSEAYDKEEAEKFCKQKLDCDVECTGTARRWICKCK
jgi:hypothetical protein